MRNRRRLLLFLFLVVGFLATALLRPRGADPDLGGAPVPWPMSEEPEVPPPAASPASAPASPPAEASFDGPTPFVRRLQAGSLMEEVRSAAALDTLDVSRAWRAILQAEPHLLRADGYRRGATDGVQTVLENLTEPSRSLEALDRNLSGPDALARQQVRVWTVHVPYPESEIRDAERMLGLLAAASGREVGCGFDVLATPKRGQEVFPHQARCPGACGVYYIRDRYCAVSSRLRPEFRAQVLRHELVHAYCRTFADRFITSRFVSEGLAEYLRLAEGTRNGLVVPNARLGHNLARLDCIFEYLRFLGCPIRRLRPGALVRLDPRQFYSLGSLGYLIAQASMAYVGPDVIRAALAEGSDLGIVRAVRTIAWQDFLCFVAAKGRYGDPDRALTVEDVVPSSADEKWSREPPALRETLAYLGVLSDQVENLDPSRLGPASGEDLGGPVRLAHTLSVITDPYDDSPLRIVTDLSPAMDRRVVIGKDAPGKLPGAKLAGTMSALAFVGRLEAALAELMVRVAPDLIGMGSRSGVVSGRLISPTALYGLSGIDQWSRPRTREDPRLVVCVSDIPPHARSMRRLGPQALEAE